MKFILILISACVFIAHGQSEFDETLQQNPIVNPQEFARGAILDHIRQEIKYLYENAIKELYMVNEKIKEIFTKTHEEIHRIVEKSKDEVHEVFHGIHEKINDLLQKGGTFKDCAKKLIPELKTIHENSQKDLDECVKSIRELAASFEQSFSQQIKESSEKLHEITSGCIQINPISAVKCAFKNVGEFNKVSVHMISQFKELVIFGGQKSEFLISEILTCHKNSITETKKQVIELAGKIHECNKGH